MIIMIVAAYAAYVVKGMCGFANTLVFSTIMGFTQSNVNISPLELIVGYPSNLILAWKNRKSVVSRKKDCAFLSMLVIAGSIPGVFVLKYFDTGVIKIFFGFVIVAVATEMLLREIISSKSRNNRVFMTILGLLSGFLCGLFGIGALLAAYVGRSTDNEGEFKGVLATVFAVENTFRIILYSATGIITLGILKNAVVLLPIMLAGLATGMLLAKRMNNSLIKKAVTIMLLLSGISLVITNLH